MNIHNLPDPMDVVTFNPGRHHYNLPKRIKNCYVVLINAGGGGGGGFSRSTGSGGGGAGGLAGGTNAFIIPPPLVSKGMIVTVGSGGTGGAAGANGVSGGLCSILNTDGMFLRADAYNGTTFGGGGTVSAGGAASGYAGLTFNSLFSQNDYYKGTVPIESGITGNIATVVTHSYSNTWGNRWALSGFGGGGVTTGGTALDGNGYTVGVSSPYLTGVTATGGLASATVDGGRGTDGITVYDPISKIIPLSTGGTGGGASTVAVGGNGGNGGVGSGGGGGGSGITGGTGGRGGDGLVILVLW